MLSNETQPAVSTTMAHHHPCFLSIQYSCISQHSAIDMEKLSSALNKLIAQEDSALLNTGQLSCVVQPLHNAGQEEQKRTTAGEDEKGGNEKNGKADDDGKNTKNSEGREAGPVEEAEGRSGSRKVVIVPEAGCLVVSDVPLLDNDQFQAFARSDLGRIVAFTIAAIFAALTLVPYWVAPKYRDPLYLLAFLGIPIVLSTQVLSFSRGKLNALLKTFDFWYLAFQMAIFCAFYPLKYDVLGVSRWAQILCTPIMFITMLLFFQYDASPYSRRMRAGLNIFWVVVFFTWGVMMRWSTIFYPKPISDAFTRVWQFYVIDTTPQTLYCTAVMTMVAFMARYVLNGLLGREYVVLNAELKDLVIEEKNGTNSEKVELEQGGEERNEISVLATPVPTTTQKNHHLTTVVPPLVAWGEHQ